MTLSAPDRLAAEYFLDDVQGAGTPGTHLRTILEAVVAGRTVSPTRRAFLRGRGYKALHSLVSGQLEIETYRVHAKAEQAQRIGVSNQQPSVSTVPNALENRLRAVRKEAQEMAARVKIRMIREKALNDERLRNAGTEEKNAAIFDAMEKKEQRRRSARKLHDLYGQDFSSQRTTTVT